jgi:hypothetical protein
MDIAGLSIAVLLVALLGRVRRGACGADRAAGEST